MLLDKSMVASAFHCLEYINPEAPEVGAGKTRRERRSALSYFLATAEAIKNLGSKELDLSPEKSENRRLFSRCVGNVVKLNDSGDFSNNFYDEFEFSQDYKCGNNFLTTLVRGTRGGLSKDYPSRPSDAELITINNEKVRLHKKYKVNITKYGDWDSYRVPFAIWLLRFVDRDVTSDKSISVLVDFVWDEMVGKYGDDIASLFIKNKKEIEEYISKSFVLETFFQPEKTDYIFLKKDYYKTTLPEETTGEISGGQNIIYYGAPGTGKSYALKELPNQIRTVFHPDYHNSDFVGSYRPLVDASDNIKYQFTPGPFIAAFVEALKHPKIEINLIIEEINRANASAVFGEIFQLLDRDENGRSEFSVHPDYTLKLFLDGELSGVDGWNGQLFLPPNLNIYATMNSADQGVSPLDSAFKRRWRFIFTPLEFDTLPCDDLRNTDLIPYAGKLVSWTMIACAINTALIDSGIGEDRLLGPYFLSHADFKNDVKYDMSSVFSGKVLIYLWDDVLRQGLRGHVFDINKSRSFTELIANYQKDISIFVDVIENKIFS